MLKTTVDTIAVPDIPLILLGLLKGYVKNPGWIRLRILAGMPRFIKRLGRDYPADLKRLCALLASMYTIFRTRLSDDKALSLVKAIAIPLGLSVQMANFRYVEDERTPENLIRYQQRTNREGPTRMNTMRIDRADNREYRFAVTGRCCFFDAFTALGMPELTTVSCEVDNAIFNVYSPDRIVFTREGAGRRIADGAGECSFVCAFCPDR